jgi:ABC-type Mn2+/Zn2+ transport system permease subunit
VVFFIAALLIVPAAITLHTARHPAVLVALSGIRKGVLSTARHGR